MRGVKEKCKMGEELLNNFNRSQPFPTVANLRKHICLINSKLQRLSSAKTPLYLNIIS